MQGLEGAETSLIDALPSLTVSGLNELSKAIEAELKTKYKTRAKEARVAATEAVKVYGFDSLDQVLNQENPKESKKAAVKYRNPANQEETWTGRGKKPNWLNKMLTAGYSLEDFKVQGAA